MKCHYCDEPAEAICSWCGASICQHHSTEDGACRVDGEPIHLPPEAKEWIARSTEAIEDWPESYS